MTITRERVADYSGRQAGWRGDLCVGEQPGDGFSLKICWRRQYSSKAVVSSDFFCLFHDVRTKFPCELQKLGFKVIGRE